MFRVYRDDQGHWCACRDDGLVGGMFCDRAEAERFARTEDRLAQSLSRRTGIAEAPLADTSAMESLAAKFPPQASPSWAPIRFAAS
jgi:hypothetical protein